MRKLITDLQKMKVYIQELEQAVEDLLHKPEEVAEYLGTSLGGLAQMRYRGNGPKFVKLGRKSVRYRDSDIKEWLEENVKDRT